MIENPPVAGLLDFNGRTVIVTGAGGGIGTGIASRFAEAGANIVIHYQTSAAGAEQLKQMLASQGRNAITVSANLTEPAGAAALIDAAYAAFGTVDVLVNNVGTYPLHAVIDMPLDAWESVIAANLHSVFLCSQAAAQQMRTAAGSLKAIINIASIEAENPAPNHSHYNAAKAAVVMFTKTAALELASHGIRVNAVSPGLIWREGLEQNWPQGVDRWQAKVPLQRLGMAGDVADACLFLASPAARWITGINIVVDGGMLCTQIY